MAADISDIERDRELDALHRRLMELDSGATYGKPVEKTTMYENGRVDG